MTTRNRFHFATTAGRYAAREQARMEAEKEHQAALRAAAMTALLGQSPEHRVRCAAGLLFSAAGDDDKAGRQLKLAELAAAAERLTNELSQRPASGSATGERKPGAVSPDNSGAGRGPSPRPAPVRQAAGGDHRAAGGNEEKKP